MLLKHSLSSMTYCWMLTNLKWCLLAPWSPWSQSKLCYQLRLQEIPYQLWRKSNPSVWSWTVGLTSTAISVLFVSHTWALQHICHLISEENAQTWHAASLWHAWTTAIHCSAACQNMCSKRLTSVCAEYTGTSGQQVRCTDSSSTSSSETPLVADPPKNLIQTGNADLQSPSCFQSTSMPQYLSSLLSVPRSTGYSLRSADHPQLYVARTRTSTAGWSFCCAGSLVWNDLLDSVVNCDTFCGFKRKLKI